MKFSPLFKSMKTLDRFGLKCRVEELKDAATAADNLCIAGGLALAGLALLLIGPMSGPLVTIAATIGLTTLGAGMGLNVAAALQSKRAKQLLDHYAAPDMPRGNVIEMPRRGALPASLAPAFAKQVIPTMKVIPFHVPEGYVRKARI